jgi:REP element-mobilizing transposase RayT
MQTYETLKRTTWDCKYHVVFITKCRKKTLYGQIRRELGPVFRELARQKECDIIEGHLMPDHVHMLVAIPPKYSVAQVVGFLKGKTAICPGVWGETPELCGPAVLGTRLLGFDGGAGRSRGASLHSGTGKRRSAARSINADAALSG